MFFYCDIFTLSGISNSCFIRIINGEAEFFLIKEELLRDILTGFLTPPLEVFSLKLISQNNHSLIEISLDNLVHPYGSVTVGDCEQVSRKLAEFLDEEFVEELYTLQVSSAGAERELRIPEDFVRFQNLPVRLYYTDEFGKNLDGIFKVIKLVEDSVELSPYQKKNAKKKVETSLTLKIKEIRKGNLYLDF